jgi:hypothetical protein
MRRPQDGQALVGALVVTTLAFLMAGAVAVGASALLSQESNPQNASTRDLDVQSVVAASVSWVAGKGTQAGGAPCSAATTLGSVLLPNGFTSQTNCIRADGVPSGPLTLLPLGWSSGCAVVDLTSYSDSHILVWLSAAGASGWIDKFPSGCKQRSITCNDAGAGSATHLLNCDLSDDEGDPQYLHVKNAGQSPEVARLAATTGVPGGPTYEAADVWVSPDGATTALRYEGPA